MSEWLTTGQMIDKLKVGEVAENKDTVKVQKINDQIFFVDVKGNVISHFGSNGIVFLNKAVLRQKWRILPKYVSFDEAMKALKDGKNVFFKGSDGSWNDKITPAEARNHALNHTSLKGHGLHDLVEGKWVVESDNE